MTYDGNVAGIRPLSAGQIDDVVVSAGDSRSLRYFDGYTNGIYLTAVGALRLGRGRVAIQNTLVVRLKKLFSHCHNYGKVGSYGLVQWARDWALGSKGLSNASGVRRPMVSTLERLGPVTVTTDINHACRGDLITELHSPGGIVNRLGMARQNDNETSSGVKPALTTRP
ncbi:hypothetical protein MGYG_09204 [Nannizzia gypsea CBS 118893]|uniref:P/Homo B domain-containing protein n=1 Tax=Arthroderma gypseum (strain ATCC MYA-4604 / CBS 118893) TaxID=535722 RepID=E4V6T8_ARTGP|nr:hypothetical protein MGYG_09204 [Nannizzia gypsea CBS 118893]EFQ96804.1 hypothetical protein MGYG_09204 [Nannizzia gypsea CBS 118893]